MKAAILREMESFILEYCKGFASVERQKRMIIDSEDFYLDLLFYRCTLKRLVAVELKRGKFHAHAKDKWQMELYLKCLERHERQKGENAPVGLILCAAGSYEQTELLEMHKDGIMVAEYRTDLPPQKKVRKKIICYWWKHRSIWRNDRSNLRCEVLIHANEAIKIKQT